MLRQAQQPCDSPTPPRRAVGLSYHGSRNIHSRIGNGDNQDFGIFNLEERVNVDNCTESKKTVFAKKVIFVLFLFVLILATFFPLHEQYAQMVFEFQHIL